MDERERGPLDEEVSAPRLKAEAEKKYTVCLHNVVEGYPLTLLPVQYGLVTRKWDNG